MSRTPVKFTELQHSFEYVSFGAPFEHAAYLCLETGEFHWHSEFGDNDEELPEDIDDESKYIAVPHKNDLDLGNRLVFRFAEHHLPDDYDEVRDMFRSRGAYRRFRELLARRNALDAWYAYENQATVDALREWCASRGVELETD
jgi:hypothetical protein